MYRVGRESDILLVVASFTGTYYVEFVLHVMDGLFELLHLVISLVYLSSKAIFKECDRESCIYQNSLIRKLDI